MQEALDEMIALRRMIQNLLGTFEPRLTKDKDEVSNRGHLHPIKRNIGACWGPQRLRSRLRFVLQCTL